VTSDLAGLRDHIARSDSGAPDYKASGLPADPTNEQTNPPEAMTNIKTLAVKTKRQATNGWHIE